MVLLSQFEVTNEKLGVKFSSFFLPNQEKDSITFERRGVEKFDP
jgi:hypothetical protein